MSTVAKLVPVTVATVVDLPTWDHQNKRLVTATVLYERVFSNGGREHFSCELTKQAAEGGRWWQATIASCDRAFTARSFAKCDPDDDDVEDGEQYADLEARISVSESLLADALRCVAAAVDAA